MTASRRNDGFSLLEIVLALGIFGTGMLGLVLMTSGLMKHNMISRQRTVAVQLARNKMETMRQKPYEEISTGVEEKLDATETIGHGIFRREVVVGEHTDPFLKEIEVTVSWQSKGTHRVILRSILAAP